MGQTKAQREAAAAEQEALEAFDALSPEDQAALTELSADDAAQLASYAAAVAEAAQEPQVADETPQEPLRHVPTVQEAQEAVAVAEALYASGKTTRSAVDRAREDLRAARQR